MNFPSPSIAVYAPSASCTHAAEQLAHSLGLQITGETEGHDFLLVLEPDPAPPGYRLQLQQTGRDAPGPISAEFATGAVGHRRRFGGGRGQPLARAVGLKGGATPDVIDATAGLGRDAFVLATLGCRVRLIERSPLVAALLENGLQRASADAEIAPVVARLTLMRGDASDVLGSLPEEERPDVIYLDPMYPHRTKSALVKKEMRLFRSLVGEDQDAAQVLKVALEVARKRVVVKRPRLAEALAGPRATVGIEGKSTRFDVYVVGVV